MVDDTTQLSSFFTTKTYSTQSHCSTVDQHFLDIFEALRLCRHVVDGQQLAIWADHRPMTFKPCLYLQNTLSGKSTILNTFMNSLRIFNSWHELTHYFSWRLMPPSILKSWWLLKRTALDLSTYYPPANLYSNRKLRCFIVHVRFGAMYQRESHIRLSPRSFVDNFKTLSQSCPLGQPSKWYPPDMFGRMSTMMFSNGHAPACYIKGLKNSNLSASFQLHVPVGEFSTLGTRFLYSSLPVIPIFQQLLIAQFVFEWQFWFQASLQWQSHRA